MKRCSQCKELKEFSAFSPATKYKDKLQSYCKDCSKKYFKTYRNKHKKRIDKYQKDWKKRNSEKTLLYVNNWRERNPEKIKQEWKNYAKNNPERIAFNAAKTRIKKKNLPFELTFEQFSLILHLPCKYCGKKEKIINSVDRIDSSKGYVITNIQPICFKCNIIKMDTNHEGFVNKIVAIYQHLKKGGLNELEKSRTG